ncbi:AmmeMemoRadiSam system protein B, partial [bacterium]|nr:AmmeMemoRadiSam system protein B [bacterium]
PIQRYIILGIAHNGLEKGFAATALDFETPLGLIKTDQQFMKKLQQEISYDLFAEELAFRDDHTVEFQTVFLKYFARQHENFSVVPILCSFSPEMLTIPEMAAPIHEFIAGLKKLLETTGESSCLIAGVDLAHVGPLYEDDFEPDATFLEQLRVKDQSTLSCVIQGNRTAFVDSISVDLAERKICGFSALYTLLSLLKPASGLLVDYDQTAMDDVHSTVSYASAVFGTR